MNRTVKQLLYGIFYLAILGLLSFGVYRLWFYKASTCADNIQNGSETDVDCGGSCIPCELKNLKLDASTLPPFPATANQSIFFATVINPSTNYAVKNFSYSIKIWSVLGTLAKTINGSSYLYAGETRYLVFPNIPLAAGDVGPISVDVSSVGWVPVTAFPKYDLSIGAVKTNIASSGGEVDGTIINNSPSAISEAKLTAILMDGKQNIISASSAPIENIPAYGAKQFQIFFPPLGRAAASVAPVKTQVFYEVTKN